MNRVRLAVALVCCWLPVSLAAQEVTHNPHGKLDEQCAVCHSANAWVPAQVSASFDHAKKGFVLTGAHRQTACRSCHANLDFHGAARECASCHQDVHHGELGTECSRCHTPRSFIDRSTMARAHQITRFPLTGTHLTLDCESCHPPSVQGQMSFLAVPVLCVECHQTQYQGAKNPDHVNGQFPTDCSQCHQTTVWTSARFNHDATGFPLTGMHASVACQQCHGDGVYAGKSTACVSCHMPDYNATNNPAHAGAGFPTSCETCHTTSGWTGASFNHTWFPVPHRTATQCGDCHLNTSNFAQFTCTNCHTQAQTDPHHTGVRGYIWNSANCYSCHPSGRAG